MAKARVSAASASLELQRSEAEASMTINELQHWPPTSGASLSGLLSHDAGAIRRARVSPSGRLVLSVGVDTSTSVPLPAEYSNLPRRARVDLSRRLTDLLEGMSVDQAGTVSLPVLPASGV